MKTMSVVGVLATLFVLAFSASTVAQTTLQLTMDNDFNSDYTLTSVSSVEVFAGSLPADDPVINLEIGNRYVFTIVNPVVHPFQVLAKGANPAEDVVVLSQGSASGSLEGDSGVNWQDDGQSSNGVISFTVTQGLVDAMNQSGLSPGYKCEAHPVSMRGDFNIVAAAPQVESVTGAGTVEEGTEVTLSVVITGTIGAVDYAWFKDGSLTPLADGGALSGTGTANLSISPAMESDSGSYVLQYTDESKAEFSTDPILLNVVAAGTLPFGGVALLVLAASACLLGSVSLVRRTRN